MPFFQRRAGPGSAGPGSRWPIWGLAPHKLSRRDTPRREGVASGPPRAAKVIAEPGDRTVEGCHGPGEPALGSGPDASPGMETGRVLVSPKYSCAQPLRSGSPVWPPHPRHPPPIPHLSFSPVRCAGPEATHCGSPCMHSPSRVTEKRGRR